jgi:hypothetical protein
MKLSKNRLRAERDLVGVRERQQSYWPVEAGVSPDKHSDLKIASTKGGFNSAG